MRNHNDDDLQDDDAELAQPRRVFRLVPLTMMMAGLLLVIKCNELYIGSRELRELYSARDAVASEPEAKKDHAAHSDADTAESGHETPAPDEGDHGDAAKEEAVDGHGAPEEAAHEESGHGGGHGEEKPPAEPTTYGTGKSTIKQIEEMKARAEEGRFTKSELDLLQNLSKRRDELDARERDLDIKSKVLDATQKRIDDKLAEMKVLDEKLSKTIALYNEKQNAQIASLVKIYESMKPAQASAIFNELDLPILLEVIDRMSERKVAPVLALMDPKKARDVTQELAAMRQAAPKAGVTK